MEEKPKNQLAPVIWLASYPKSGNTWVRFFLGCYLNGGTFNINYMPTKVSLADDNLLLHQAVLAKPLHLCSEYEVLMCRSAVLQRMYTMAEQPIFLKTHNMKGSVFGFDLCPEPLTQASVVIMRNPLDLLPSLMRHMGINAEEAIKFMTTENSAIHREKELGGQFVRSYLNTWENFYKGWATTQKSQITLKYEDILADPEEEFYQLVDFLFHVTNNQEALRPDRELVKRCVEATSLEKMKAQEERFSFKESSKKAGEFFGASDGIKQQVSAGQLAELQRKLYDSLVLYKYIEPDAVVQPSKPKPVRKSRPKQASGNSGKNTKRTRRARKTNTSKNGSRKK